VRTRRRRWWRCAAGGEFDGVSCGTDPERVTRTLSRRRLIALGAPLPLALVACGGGDDGPPPVIAATVAATEPPPGRSATASPTAPASVTASATPRVVSAIRPGDAPCGPELDPADLCGFAFPVAGACLTPSDLLMPNAPRTYRNGVHEGIDFYPGLACAEVRRGTPVLAMRAGTVSRADVGYHELTVEELRALRALTARLGYSDEETLDVYRGRQVWVDHGRGIVTRYAHLSSIADGVRVGTPVRAGQVLGGIGESGTPESIEAPGTELHLHAELRVGATFLGAALPAETVRALYRRVFGVA
jgi:hypothetical protein